MKKIYLSVMAASLAVAAGAQQGMQQVTETKDAYEKLGEAPAVKSFHKAPFLNYTKASGDSIWSEDFNGAPGWNTGGAQDIWAFDTDGPNGQYSDTSQIIESTTAGNGFMIYDADVNQSPTPGGGFFNHVGWLETPVIDFTGYTNLTLIFQHTYRSCCAQGFEPKIEVSDDGFATSEVYGAGIPGVGANDTPPTTITKVDLSDFISNATNLANVQIRFLFDGSAGTTHYWWQLDDIAIIESFNNDLILDDYFLASGALKIPYHQVPPEQLVDVEFSALIGNIGVDPQTNAVLDVVADDGTNQDNVSSAGVTINPDAVDSVAATTNWLPSGTPGTVYDLTLTALQAESEQEPSDNEETDVFTITDSVYSVDNGTISGFISNFQGNTNQAFKIGNNMEIMDDTYITSMSVYVRDLADAETQEIYGEIQKFDGTDYIFEGSTDFYALQSSDLGTLVTLTFPTPIQVNAGDDILLLAGHNGSLDANIDDVSFGMAQTIPQGFVAGAASDGELAVLTDPSAVVIRANLNPNVSVNELKANEAVIGQSFPNPFTNTTSIEYNLKNAGEVSYSVVDVAGKELMSKNEGTVAAGGHKITVDGSDLSTGVYYLNLNVAGKKVTRKLMVK